jgi:tubulin polyglutamylase complex subunit 2
MSENTVPGFEEASSSMRELFNNSSLNILSYLSLYDEISSVSLSSSIAKSSSEIVHWEKKNLPYKIPADMKEFYATFNGIHLLWKVNVAGRQCTIGDLGLLSCSEIQRVPLDGIFFASLISPPPDSKSCAAFVISRLPRGGRVTLLYRSPTDQASSSLLTGVQDGLKVSCVVQNYDEPEVWLQDTNSRWYFMCGSFSQYYRLSLVHLGIIGWQDAFTPAGLSPTTKQWMGIFCKERLLVDIAGHQPVDAQSNS